MRTFHFTGTFKKDFKREKKGRHRKTVEADLQAVLDLLASDAPLPQNYNDHPLTGDWKDFRDCHVLPDLVLIYRKVGTDGLELARLGSHSELGI